jgi:hypothetical protein
MHFKLRHQPSKFRTWSPSRTSGTYNATRRSRAHLDKQSRWMCMDKGCLSSRCSRFTLESPSSCLRRRLHTDSGNPSRAQYTAPWLDTSRAILAAILQRRRTTSRARWLSVAIPDLLLVTTSSACASRSVPVFTRNPFLSVLIFSSALVFAISGLNRSCVLLSPRLVSCRPTAPCQPAAQPCRSVNTGAHPLARVLRYSVSPDLFPRCPARAVRALRIISHSTRHTQALPSCARLPPSPLPV